MEKTKTPSHPLNIFTVSDIVESVSSCLLLNRGMLLTFFLIQPSPNFATGLTFGPHTAITSIACNGVGGNNPMELNIKAKAYILKSQALRVDHIYALSGHILPLNQKSAPSFCYSTDTAIRLGLSDQFPVDLKDKMFVVGFGIIVEKTEDHDGRFEKPTVVCKVRHTDYDNEACVHQNFLVEYWIPASRLLVNIQVIFQIGRELSITGYIIDWNMKTRMCIVEVSGVSLATGHQTIPESRSLRQDKQSPSKFSRRKLKRIVFDEDPKEGPNPEVEVELQSTAVRREKEAVLARSEKLFRESPLLSARVKGDVALSEPVIASVPEVKLSTAKNKAVYEREEGELGKTFGRSNDSQNSQFKRSSEIATHAAKRMRNGN